MKNGCRPYGRLKEADAERWYNIHHEETSGNKESENGAVARAFKVDVNGTL